MSANAARDASAAGALFDLILFAADRDQAPGVRPVVAFDPADEPPYLAALRRHGAREIALVRRGVSHGRVAELDPKRLVRKPPGRRKLEAILSVRWQAARPVFLAELLENEVGGLRREIRSRQEFFERSTEPGALRDWIAAGLGSASHGVELPAATRELADPERDIECVPVAHPAADVHDLWIKSGRLSTWPDDRSRRLRFSFGTEGDDDAAREPRRLGLTRELARTLLPESRVLEEHGRLNALLKRFTGREVTFSQHIAYWNAPQGGALFHHDAFDEPFEERQLGVCYAQLSGRTVWLALSLEDLALRAIELLQMMQEGELAWVREELFGRADDWSRALQLAADQRALERELALPGCGRLASLVNRGPEFTALLADSGHALVLRPGDVLLLPNHGLHGLERTAMHSVFCAGEQAGYGLSLAMRASPQRPD
jgi:hypothetical protein